MLLSFVTMLLYYGGYLQYSIEWMMGLDLEAIKMNLITVLGLCGIGAFLLTYPIMRNASLKPKSRKE